MRKTTVKDVALLVLIASYSGITQKEIIKIWNYKKHGELGNAKSFKKALRRIEEAFNVIIVCDGRNQYRIVGLDHLKDTSTVLSWLVENMIITQLTERYKSGLSKRFMTVKTNADKDMLQVMFESMVAMKRMKVMMKYQDEDVQVEWIEPWAVIGENYDWIVIGKSNLTEAGELKAYYLKDFSRFEMTNVEFRMYSNFDVQEWYRENGGVQRNNRPKRKVVFSVNDYRHSHELRENPVHESQREIGKGLFEIHAVLNEHLIGSMALLHHSKKIQVEHPTDLKKEIALFAHTLLLTYGSV